MKRIAIIAVAMVAALALGACASGSSSSAASTSGSAAASTTSASASAASTSASSTSASAASTSAASPAATSSSAAASSAAASSVSAAAASSSAAASTTSASAASAAAIPAASSAAEQVIDPWTVAETPEAAAENAGVGYFMLPDAGTEIAGPVGWDGYRSMDNVAEATGYVGAAKLVVRKGLKQNGTDVSDDFTAYAHTWTQQVGDWEVTCFGNEEGRAMKAIWTSDNFAYSFFVRGQGAVYDTYGLDAEATEALVSAIQ